jgi:hypothetical protein
VGKINPMQQILSYHKSIGQIEERVNFTRSGVTAALIVTADSGKIIYRGKIDTIIGVPHPGLILGQDIWGTWVIHNHYLNGKAEIETLETFSAGQDWFYDDREVFYNRYEIIDRAITDWNKKEKYNWLTNNCQHFINRITRNEHESDTVDRVSNNVMLGGGLLTLIGLLTKNKGLLNAGLGIAGAGALGKGISRMTK